MKKQWITGITILTMTAVLTACGGTGNSSTGNAGPSDKSSSLESILQDEYNSDTDSPEESQTDIKSALSDNGLEDTCTSYASDTEPAAEKASSLETTVEDPPHRKQTVLRQMVSARNLRKPWTAMKHSLMNILLS